ncbi:hypothetical protein GE09DRAFT_330706 [Coniochaeta sp. 2T2.1]|nr:hypothetical protein GE09DRAFT_330706 [Coniochaeta sp. 2T2.1]
MSDCHLLMSFCAGFRLCCANETRDTVDTSPTEDISLTAIDTRWGGIPPPREHNALFTAMLMACPLGSGSRVATCAVERCVGLLPQGWPSRGRRGMAVDLAHGLNRRAMLLQGLGRISAI